MKKEFGPESFDQQINQKYSRFQLGDDLAQKCLDQFYKFANYTSVPVAWPVYEPLKNRINKFSIYY